MSLPQPLAPDPPHFSGSYRPDDVRFLLMPIEVDPIALADKERLIQSGQRHYSEMLSRETLPSPRYLAIFHDLFAMTRRRMARDLLDLAAILDARRSGEITLVSLARAGTPVGVILKHVLERVFRRQAVHYSISIIRDRGIDQNALRFILSEESRDPSSLVFVDGWTGKGVIARELAGAIAGFNQAHGVRLDASLFILTDLAGVGIAPSDEDILIPSSILNATLSGLVSRSILNDRIGPADFHGCVYYPEFAPADLSLWFVDELLMEVQVCLNEGIIPCPAPVDPAPARQRVHQLVEMAATRFGLTDENLIKPGIGEATRVLLRRVPERLLMRDPDLPEVAHLLQLAQEKGVHWDTDPALDYKAVSLIKDLSHA